jgi:hypothetical protein
LRSRGICPRTNVRGMRHINPMLFLVGNPLHWFFKSNHRVTVYPCQARLLVSHEVLDSEPDHLHRFPSSEPFGQIMLSARCGKLRLPILFAPRIIPMSYPPYLLKIVHNPPNSYGTTTTYGGKGSWFNRPIRLILLILPNEQEKWNRYMDKYHYLGFRCFVADSMKHVGYHKS